jgi:hypothetical protein
VENPPTTRIVIAPVAGGGMKFVDPPIGWAGARGLLIIAILFAIAAAVAAGVGWMLHSRDRQTSTAIATACITLFCAAVAHSHYLDARRTANRPTIVQISNGNMAIALPERLGWRGGALQELKWIMASQPRRVLGSNRRTGYVRVRGWGLTIKLLAGRDYAEVLWFAGQLRRAAGLADDLGEARANPQWKRQPLPVPSSPTGRPHDWARVPVQTPDAPGQIESARRWTDSEFNKIGCFGGLVWFVGLIIGCFVAMHLAVAVVICIQCGSDAYFHQGVHLVRSSKLSNGQTISNSMTFLMFAIWTAEVYLWKALLTYGVIAAKRVFMPSQESAPTPACGASPRRPMR